MKDCPAFFSGKESRQISISLNRASSREGSRKNSKNFKLFHEKCLQRKQSTSTGHLASNGPRDALHQTREAEQVSANTIQEQASFSLAVPGPLGGDRAFFFIVLRHKGYENRFGTPIPEWMYQRPSKFQLLPSGQAEESPAAGSRETCDRSGRRSAGWLKASLARCSGSGTRRRRSHPLARRSPWPRCSRLTSPAWSPAKAQHAADPTHRAARLPRLGEGRDAGLGHPRRVPPRRVVEDQA